jgi:nicotinamide riboside kinase
MAIALVVGEFCPLVQETAGRIRSLIAADGGVAVLVTDAPVDLVPAAVRASWVARACPGAAVSVLDGSLDPSQLRDRLGGTPTAVWGDPVLARALGVGSGGAIEAGSSAAARHDAAASWPALPPVVRGGLTRRICFVGAESTGKTTLSRRLAERHGTVWVPEYGRDYTIEKIHEGTNDHWSTDDFVIIARRQGEIEDEVAEDAGPLLLCDTDAFATAIWHERYLHEPAPAVEAIAAARRYDLYVLCGIDVPFEQDGVRFSESIRPWMQQRFRDGLAARSEPWIEISGSIDARVAAVDAEIHRLGLLTGPSMLARSRWAMAEAHPG